MTFLEQLDEWEREDQARGLISPVIPAAREVEVQAVIDEGTAAAAEAAEEPIGTIKAVRRTGHAIVTVARGDRVRRYRVSLRRYRRLREWAITQLARTTRTSGAWLRSGMTVHLWGPPT